MSPLLHLGPSVVTFRTFVTFLKGPSVVTFRTSCYICAFNITLPGAQFTNFNDGGGGVLQRFIFYTQKITTSEFVYPKKSLLFLAYPKKSLSPFFITPKTSCFFRDPKKIPASFIDPKNHFWPKFQTQKNHSNPAPPVIKICELGP